MEQNKNDVKLGRFISLVLRHNPSAAGIKLDKNGWADVKELINGVKKSGHRIDMETLERIVRENNKQRYSFNDDHSKIRANQGHSVNVDVELKEQVPPKILYHGTALRYLDQIKVQGLTKQSRQHVHLSADQDTAYAVGKRHGKPVILCIAAQDMHDNGEKFWLSENGVWLCNSVPWAYISMLKESKND